MEEIYGGAPFGVVALSNTPLGPGSLRCLEVLEKKNPQKRRRKKGRTPGIVWMDEIMEKETI